MTAMIARWKAAMNRLWLSVLERLIRLAGWELRLVLHWQGKLIRAQMRATPPKHGWQRVVPLDLVESREGTSEPR